MTRLRLFTLVCVLAMTLSGCAGKNADLVVVVGKTNKYHTQECKRVKMAETKTMTIAEARALNCKACKGCNPDRRK